MTGAAEEVVMLDSAPVAVAVATFLVLVVLAGEAATLLWAAATSAGTEPVYEGIGRPNVAGIAGVSICGERSGVLPA